MPSIPTDGAVDCGVIAIAFATDLCHGLDPVAVTYDQEKMRQHLLTCLENKKLEPFPRMEKAGKVNARVIKTIHVYCHCKPPECFDAKMVECESCLCWYHYRCVGITTSQDTNHWLCRLCVQNRPKRRRIT